MLSQPASASPLSTFDSWIELAVAWGSQPWVWWTSAGVSVAIMIVSAIAIPWFLAKVPVDYFSGYRPQRRRWTLALAAVSLARNVLGTVLLLLGIAMLVLPGQGLLTILLAIFLMDFPRKRRFMQRLLRQRTVLRVINALRARRGSPPLELAPSETTQDREPRRRA